MRKSLLIQTAILSLIIIIIFFSYKFFFHEEQKNQVSLLSKTDENSIEKKGYKTIIDPIIKIE